MFSEKEISYETVEALTKAACTVKTWPVMAALGETSLSKIATLQEKVTTPIQGATATMVFVAEETELVESLQEDIKNTISAVAKECETFHLRHTALDFLGEKEMRDFSTQLFEVNDPEDPLQLEVVLVIALGYGE